MCAYPYIKEPHGVSRLSTMYDQDRRNAATPFGCGRCLPCRINRARIWQSRLLLEQSVSNSSAFVTLTYDDDHINRNWHLDKKDLQNYLKRLRGYFESGTIRHFAVGEYGDVSWRPHFHIAIFGMVAIPTTVLSNCWRDGFVMVGELTAQSARYIAGYVVKKLTNPKDTRLEGRPPEFATMSLKNGGIGYGAVKVIAEKLKKNPYLKLNGVLKQFNIGKRGLPLGRYLTKKLNEELGADEAVINRDLWDYQEDLFNKHLREDVCYYQSIVDEHCHDRHVMEKRKKIYKQRKTL